MDLTNLKADLRLLTLIQQISKQKVLLELKLCMLKITELATPNGQKL